MPDVEPTSVGKEPTEEAPQKSGKKDAWDKSQIVLTFIAALFSTVTALLVFWLTSQANSLKTAFDESVSNSQIVVTLVPALASARTSDLALITLWYHFHGTGGNADPMMVDLAKSVLETAQATAQASGAVAKNTLLNRFALQTIIKTDDPTYYQTFTTSNNQAQPRPAPTSGQGPAGQGKPLSLTAGQQQQQLIARSIVGAEATVYIQYTTKGVSDQRTLSALTARAQNLASTLRAKGIYSVPDIESTTVTLTRTSVRYYWQTQSDLQLAQQLQRDASAILDIPVGLHYNGPAKVPHGQLEIWMAETN